MVKELLGQPEFLQNFKQRVLEIGVGFKSIEAEACGLKL